MNHWSRSLGFYSMISQNSQHGRLEQAERVSELIDISSLDRIEVIETGASQNFADGCFGLFFGHAAMERSGKFSSVDINEEYCNSSREIFSKFLPDLDYNVEVSDSVDFLKRYEGSPTIVHLDSWDLDIFNPEPAMLHGFLEFQAIEGKMESGSYIVVDDNFMRGTFVYWNYNNGTQEEHQVRQEILGKGSMIYHYCKKEDSGWELIGEYPSGPNQKIVLRKK